MSHEIKKSQEIRNEESINAIINDAIKEVIDELGDIMTDRDKDMLQAVIDEKGTNPHGRVIYLSQIVNSVGVSPQLKDYVNQALMTIRKNLSTSEQDMFRGVSEGHHLLRDIS